MSAVGKARLALLLLQFGMLLIELVPQRLELREYQARSAQFSLEPARYFFEFAQACLHLIELQIEFCKSCIESTAFNHVFAEFNIEFRRSCLEVAQFKTGSL